MDKKFTVIGNWDQFDEKVISIFEAEGYSLATVGDKESGIVLSKEALGGLVMLKFYILPAKTDYRGNLQVDYKYSTDKEFNSGGVYTAPFAIAFPFTLVDLNKQLKISETHLTTQLKGREVLDNFIKESAEIMKKFEFISAPSCRGMWHKDDLTLVIGFDSVRDIHHVDLYTQSNSFKVGSYIASKDFKGFITSAMNVYKTNCKLK
jgi:hypothetical protein